MDYNVPSSSIHGILQARILEWLAIPFSRDLPDPGIEPGFPALLADFFTIWSNREAHYSYKVDTKYLLTELVL